MQGKRASDRELALDGKPSAHGFGDSFGEGEPEAGAMELGGLDPRAARERIEDKVDFRRIDPDAAIGDRNPQFTDARMTGGRTGRADGNEAILAAVFDRISDEVLQALGDTPQ